MFDSCWYTDGVRNENGPLFLPICFLLLAIEFVFRMRRLAASEIGPRDDAVSAA